MNAERQPAVLAVIPARYASTRFPGKVIAPLGGKPLVVHTYENTSRAQRVTQAVVATDDERVIEAVRPYGVPAVMTRADHSCGTNRIAEVAEQSDAAIIVNVQGDEPLIDPGTVDAAVGALIGEEEVSMVTARRRINEPRRIQDPNVVKVVCDQRGRALYFSRSAIPHIRDQSDREAAAQCYWQHIGIYAFRRDFLLVYAKLPATPLERLEKLEQLRALEHGYAIRVVDTEHDSLGVDSPEDLDRVSALLARIADIGESGTCRNTSS
jgi:3-deoxy-manno-octulosonate cytidylyltransferase (CMP-KDO synthetase)